MRGVEVDIDIYELGFEIWVCVWFCGGVVSEVV